MTTPTSSLRARLTQRPAGPIVVPGVGSPLEAHAAVASGFDTIYVSGYAVSAWRYGVPDVGLIALDEIAGAVDAVVEAIGQRGTPTQVICDADTGYGDVANVARTVRRLERRGASAVQLEDQAWPKRCGHLRGKTVIAAAEHARKISAAAQARENPDTMIIARTDALAPYGVDDAIARARLYADAGADLLFVDAPTSVDDLERIANALSDHVLVANMSESGLTPHLTAQEFHELGFSVVLYPTAALRVATTTVLQFFADLHATGDTHAWVERMTSLDDLNSLVGLDTLEKFDDEVSGAGPDGSR